MERERDCGGYAESYDLLDEQFQIPGLIGLIHRSDEPNPLKSDYPRFYLVPGRIRRIHVKPHWQGNHCL